MRTELGKTEVFQAGAIETLVYEGAKVLKTLDVDSIVIEASQPG